MGQVKNKLLWLQENEDFDFEIWYDEMQRKKAEQSKIEPEDINDTDGRNIN